ncbi:hypothetical protein GCM10011331_04680 [Flavimobilis marinus]|uniref:2',3'-cyclic-nucleotide 2'-phosphodiesterase/5'-or 3'-nucleotidase, 5'-nucleotidase family n=1 Tax=Flavimobilis marinus TaxID=285351 RepID=A0A1I2DEL4_9MICO|nr:hypothetical protein GCM10011331_04680 [Flavimobilis marinus]SFE79042.1 2',3'-cyclic-nucleotide 2'-phosphodiesterase/5'-or 3'-nucleotidase, 5'-nucleotidase family [Flavimobilis marinus]
MDITKGTRVRLAAAVATGSLIGGGLVAVPASAAPGDTVAINLLNINDFHGRIDAKTVQVAGTIEKLRDEAGEASTLFLSNGDNIGASLFASASQRDEPTIDVLNALELATSSVGNHEFDGGFADLTGRVADRADFTYLGANVYKKGTATPALPEYDTFEVNGVTVGVIGTVSEETPSLVTPAGIADLAFGDPVAAVNRVAAQLSDGREANGEADIIVAEFHEGAGAGTPEGATLAQEVAAGGAFADIVTKTSALVDVIFTGHTHKEYAWEAPVPGAPDAKRPILQTGSYGDNIGQVQLQVDPATGLVKDFTVGNVKRSTTAPADLVAAYPRVAEVNTIVTAALAAADKIGSQPKGTITGDITRARTEGTSDDRASESTLGGLVANSLRDSAPGADIGVVNPGGLRADLLFAKDSSNPLENADGIVTYAEANAVLPFLNNVWTTSLSGTQLKTLLEQQWQTNPDGSIPSRPYLQLGLSDNVRYTFDASRPAGDRITSITVDGTLVTADDSFRIGTFSFLATGGDNFRVFTDGSNPTDTGLVDREAWISYLEDNPNITPDFARRSVQVSGNPASAQVGTALDIDVSMLDLTSLGSPDNATLAASFTGGSLTSPVALGSFPVADGAATVAGSVPASAAGATTLTLVAAPSGTTVTLPLEVAAKPVTPIEKSRTAMAVRVLDPKTRYGTPAVVKVAVRELKSPTTGKSAQATGVVEVREGSRVLGRATLKKSSKHGVAYVELPKTLSIGKHRVTAHYLGSDTALPYTAKPRTIKVYRARTTATAKVSRSGKTVWVTVKAKGTKATGKVSVRIDGRYVGTKTLQNGKAKLKVKRPGDGRTRYVVTYFGTSTALPDTWAKTVRLK